MNVIQRENICNQKIQRKNELVRRDSALGIRGSTIPKIGVSCNTAYNKVPRYHFSNDDSEASRSSRTRSAMGPPSELPKSSKRKLTKFQNSIRLESSSSSCKPRNRVLASDSTAGTAQEFSTPKNRPTALRYISSSSKGIRGSTIPKIGVSCNTAYNKVPRYHFSNDDSEASRSSRTRSAMGPPSELPKSSKRKLTKFQNSIRLESSSSSCKPRNRVLASDSTAGTAQEFSTPKNRPTALRYISSSSKGGFSGNRSSARSTSTSIVEASVILAISEGRGMARGEIGIAAIDLRHPHLVLCQFSDTLLYTHTLTKINYFNPVEIIVPHTFCEGTQPNQLYKLIRDQYPLLNLTTVQRRHFNDAAGRQQIQSLCAPQYNAVYLQVLQKFYALTAAAAVLKYVEYIQCIVFARESLKIEYHSSENTMIIDVGTATQLELVHPLVPSAGPTCCLLGVLGPTYTIGGIRALRAAILQPSCKREFIEARQDAIEDLNNNESGLMMGLQDVIKKLSDIDKILLLCMESPNQSNDKMGEAQLNQTLLLKTTMDMVPSLVEALTVAECGVLRKIKMDFENPTYSEIAERIRNIIQDDAHLEKGAMGSLQRCFAVKPDINGLLDVARRTYSELIEDIQKLVEQLSENFDLPLRLNQNVMKGFHIVLSIAPKNRRSFNVEELPSIFIQVQNNGASVSMTTEELVVMDQQAKESLREIQKMSNIVISGLLRELRPFMSSLYKLCENVAELDILIALAQVSSIGSYVRPEFSNYMCIRNSVHPLLDYNSQVMPVPNDIYASPEHSFTIVTGPNMGGKSIYIKQIALIQIMAQLGCFLPATNAVLRLCDRVFSRIGFNDSVELNASTYVYEMKEMQHILQGITSKSLVIIDELCRGTSNDEGTSIAWAICEELIMTDAFTFFTTHFIYLTRLQELYFNVTNLHTVVSEENISSSEKRLVYKHKIEHGISKIEHYGLALAVKTNLPEETVNLAKELASLITTNRTPYAENNSLPSDERLLYELNSNIRREARKNISDNSQTTMIIRKFRNEHPQVLQRLRAQQNKENKTDDSIQSTSSRINKNTVDKSYKYSSNSIITPTPQYSKPEFSIYKPLYSKSDDTHIREQQNSNICPSVKSSNELLYTFLQLNESSLDNNLNIRDIEVMGARNNSQLLGNSRVQNSLILSKSDESNDHITHLNVSNNIELFGDTEMNNKHGKVLNESSSNKTSIHSEISATTSEASNSDIAEALTQVLEEYTTEDETADLRKSISQISIDEELLEETVKEINVDLICGIRIENLVLTPPLEFRD